MKINNISDLNTYFRTCIDKYNLEGHKDVFGGFVWFALCLQDKPATCIADHEKNRTYCFSTPRYDNNVQEMYEIIQHHIDIIETKLNEKRQTAIAF